jgi:fucose permease
MRKIIHHLRKQPEEIRRHILHIITFVFVVIMVGLWVLSLSKNLSNPDTQIKMKQDLQPFNELKNNVVDSSSNQ